MSEGARQGDMPQAPYFIDWLSTTWKPILALLILTIVWYFLSTYPINIIAEFIHPQIRGEDEGPYLTYYMSPMVDHPLKESTVKILTIGAWLVLMLTTFFIAIKKTLRFNYQRRLARNPKYLTIRQRYGQYASLWFFSTLKTQIIAITLFSCLYLWATPTSNYIAEMIYPQIRGEDEGPYLTYYMPPMVDHPLKDQTAYWISISAWASVSVFFVIFMSLKTLVIIKKLPKKPAKRKKYHIGHDNRYRYNKPLASDEYGEIYKAYDTTLKREVALKRLFSEMENTGNSSKRFMEEAQALAALDHPNIVPIYDIFTDNGCWIVMRFLSGGDLMDKINITESIDIIDAVNTTIQVAGGLSAAHKKNIIHRDIKPHNILFDENDTALISDFGIAKSAVSIVKTQIGITMGTPAYLSPEQYAGYSADYRSDIYSLGITLYQMVTGTLPFTGDTVSVIKKHIKETPKSTRLFNPDIGNDLEQIIQKMIEKNPDDRYQTAEQLSAALIQVKHKIINTNIDSKSKNS